MAGKAVVNVRTPNDFSSRLANALAANGKAEMPLQEMFWGGYFGSLVDQFGINRMFNCTGKI